MVGAQHGRPWAAGDLAGGGAERSAGIAQWGSHGARAVVHSAGELRADRGAARLRLSDRLPRRQRLLRGDVCGGADSGIDRLFGGSRLPGRRGAGATTARVTDTLRRRLAWGAARLAPIAVLLAAWEIFARSGAVTPFMLPALSAVAERIYDDAAGGELL